MKEFDELAARIKAAKQKDRDTLEMMKSATDAWKQANAELTALNKDMDHLVRTMVGNATALPNEIQGVR